MLGPFYVQGAAESDASVRLAVGANNHSPVRSHVPGTRRDRAPADGAGIKKGLAVAETPSEGKGPQTRCIAFGKGSHRRNRAGGDPNPIRLWAVFKKGPAHDPLPENPGTGREVVGIFELRGGRA
jgi:hypothetical protein